MTSFGKLVFGIIILSILGVGLYFLQKEPKTNIENPIEDWQKYPLDIIPAEQYPLEKIEGRKEDLISFSIFPEEKVSGNIVVQGIVKGGYFFEANILINILDSNKQVIRTGHATAVDDWMTAEPVKFQGEVDFSGLKPGLAYVEIHNDNASGLPENDKFILVPIIIE